MWAKRRVSVFGAALFFKLLTDHKEPATETRHPKWSLIHRLSRSLAVCRSFFQFSVSLPVLSASSSLVPQSPAAVIKSIYSTGNRVSFAFFLPNFQKSDALDPTQPTGSDDDACSLQRLKSLWNSLDSRWTGTRPLLLSLFPLVCRLFRSPSLPPRPPLWHVRERAI